jgi:multiple sugar transport system substrate-binding protein
VTRAAAAAAIAAMAAALALALAGGCRGGDAATVTVRFWAMGREGEVVAELIAGFEREHPGVHVEVQTLPWMAAHEKLLTAFVGEATPDLAQLGNTWVPELAALGALAPLGDATAASEVVRKADYFDGIWRTNEAQGLAGGAAGPALYGVPWYVDTRLLFYRRDLWREATGRGEVPQTWAGWLGAMRAIKARSGAVAGGRYAILLPLDEFEQPLTLALSEADPLLRDGDTRGNFRSAGFRHALAFYLRLFVEKLAPLATQVQASNPWHELGRGYVASIISGPWAIGELSRRLPPEQQASWATAPIPGPAGPGSGIAGGASLVIFRSAAHPREAWQLIEYLSRPEVQRRFYELTGNLPPRRTTWADPALAGDERARAFR